MDQDSTSRLLYLLKSRGPSPSAALARALGITLPGIRQHLARLAAEGLVEHAEEAGKVGRPRRIWRLTAAGHARFPDAHADLTVGLIASVRDLFGAEGLDRLIARREAATLATYRAALGNAKDLAARVRALARLRSAEGYMAEARRQADGSWLLVENHCPICVAAKACQGFCRAELDVFRAALGPGATVERSEHLLAGARRCAYRITPL
jgi:predicted ArsR family transcriptional regulator